MPDSSRAQNQNASQAPAPATKVVWHGRVRSGLVALHGVSGTNTSTSVDLRTNLHLDVTATTVTAVGRVGLTVGLAAADASAGVANGGDNAMTTDDFSGWWQMTPKLTMKAGVLGVLASSYSANARASNFFAMGASHNIAAQTLGGDPAAVQLAYADGPLGVMVQVEDGANAGGVSAFGVSGKATYRKGAFGFDLSGHFWGNPVAGASGGSGIALGAGYTSSSFILDGAIGTGQRYNTTTIDTWGSMFARLNLGHKTHLELKVDHNFAGAAAEGNPTFAGAGLYYSPASQITIGAEAGYQWDSAVAATTRSGTYTAGLVTQFSF